ncbi:hypothetical protein JQ597_00205 [Bradyrhizobium sp. AUGA SZCCT0177]|uniref:hypothetical protein n=1 Tax=Bradyrhizobium sp. AUGA SZCCT0177 TaxID=2807665 RepID=UPI001BAC257C|nr:hypothetical protein [Bradyrhizobium sp. AUGA SZCCT0177]MBR1280471.1 hypothetical protein [Bradyrhizobium sp. AUGA SZCCT0177]
MGCASLVIPCDSYRPAPGALTLRLHIGLENVDDLKADLDRRFTALKAANQRRDFCKQISAIRCCTAADAARAATVLSVETRILAGADTNRAFTMTANPAVSRPQIIHPSSSLIPLPR